MLLNFKKELIMSVLRNKHKANFSQFPNELILDRTISPRAFKIMCYLLSVPDNWEVNNTDVCKKLGISQEMISKYWKELITRGWITRYSRSRINGKYANYEYHINDAPSTITTGDLQDLENTSELKRQGGEITPLTNTQSSNNTHSNNNTNIIKEKINKKETNIQEVIDYYNQVCNKKVRGDELVISDINKLLTKYTLDEIKLVIDYISTNQWHIEHEQATLTAMMRPTLFFEKLEKALLRKDKPIINNKPINNVKTMAGANCNTTPVEDDFAVLRRQKELGILNVEIPKTMWQLLTPEQKQKYLDKGFKPNE